MRLAALAAALLALAAPARAIPPATPPAGALDCSGVSQCLTAEKKSCSVSADRLYCGCLVKRGCYATAGGKCDATRQKDCTAIVASRANESALVIIPDHLAGTAGKPQTVGPIDPKTLKIVHKGTGLVQVNPPPKGGATTPQKSLHTIREMQIGKRPIADATAPGSFSSKRTRGKVLRDRKLPPSAQPAPMPKGDGGVTPLRVELTSKTATPKGIASLFGSPHDADVAKWVGPGAGPYAYPDRNSQQYWPVTSCEEYAYQRNFEYSWFKDKARENAWTAREVFAAAMQKTAPGLNRPVLSTFGPADDAGHTAAGFQFDRKTKIPWNIIAQANFAIYGDTSIDTYKGKQPGDPQTDIFARHALLEASYANLDYGKGAGAQQQAKKTLSPEAAAAASTVAAHKGVSDGEFKDILQRLRSFSQKLVQLQSIEYHFWPFTCQGRPIIACKKDTQSCTCKSLKELQGEDTSAYDFFGSDAGPVPDAGPFALANYGALTQSKNTAEAGAEDYTDYASCANPPDDAPKNWLENCKKNLKNKNGKGGQVCGKPVGFKLTSPMGKNGLTLCQGAKDCAKCYSWVSAQDAAWTRVSKDLQAAIAYEKSLGANGCLHPDPNTNKCNWAYSMFATWVLNAGNKTVEQDYSTCTRLAPDPAVLSKPAAQVAAFQAKSLYPWCNKCVDGCCPVDLSDKCSGNPASAAAISDYSKSLATVEHYFNRAKCARSDWARYTKALTAEYFKMVAKNVKSIKDLPYGKSIGNSMGDDSKHGSDLFGYHYGYNMGWRVGNSPSGKGTKGYGSDVVNGGTGCSDKSQAAVAVGCCAGSPCVGQETHICAMAGSVGASAQADAMLLGKSISIIDASATESIDGTKTNAKYALTGMLIDVLGAQIPKPSTNDAPVDDNGLTLTQPGLSTNLPKPPYSQTFMAGPIPVTVHAGMVLSAGFAINAGGRGEDNCSNPAYKVGFSLQNQVSPYVRADAFGEAGVGFDAGVVGASAGIKIDLNVVTLSLPFNLTFALDDSNGVTFSAQADAQFDALSGSVDLYAEADLLFVSETWQYELFGWDGLHNKQPLAHAKAGFPVKFFSWHEYPPKDQ